MTVAQSEGQPAGQDEGLPAELITRIREAVDGIPVDDEERGGDLYDRILSATSVDDLNAPWSTESSADMAGKTITIRSIKQRASTLDEGSGVFIIGEGADFKTGEQISFTTSAVAAVLQLARAYQLGMFPLTVEFMKAERPTKRGKYPIHLKVLGAGGPGKAPF